MEEWKDIEGFEDYQISSLGRVYSKRRKAYLKEHPDPKGYIKVSLQRQNKRYTLKVHRLVAKAFIPNPKELPQVNHIDEDKSNNYVGNLEWCDNTYNQNYGTRSERMKMTLTNRENESIPVLCVETGTIYPSIREAFRQTHIRNISECCMGYRNTAGGFHWKYATNKRRINGFMQEISNGIRSNVGDKVYVPNERNGYFIKARDDRFIICTKKIAGNTMYFIIDLEEKRRGPDDNVFCDGYVDTKSCEERLNELQMGKLHVSKRHGIPLDIDIE